MNNKLNEKDITQGAWEIEIPVQIATTNIISRCKKLSSRFLLSSISVR